MPESGVEMFSHDDILSFEEIYRICSVMAKLGIKKVKLTGGEPLVRKDFPHLVSMIHSIPGIEDITLTTNGVLLNSMAKQLHENGLTGINLSLDTLIPEDYANITRIDAFHEVMAGFDKCMELGIKVKINVVPCKEFNEEQLIPLAGLAKKYPADVRFIELMPIGLGSFYSGIDSKDILAMLKEAYGPFTMSDTKHGNGPAVYVDFKNFMGSIGFISPMSHKFCKDCNRVRITADGRLKLCLYYDGQLSLRDLIRNGISDEELEDIISKNMYNKPASHSFVKNKADESEMGTMNKIGG